MDPNTNIVSSPNIKDPIKYGLIMMGQIGQLRNLEESDSLNNEKWASKLQVLNRENPYYIAWKDKSHDQKMLYMREEGHSEFMKIYVTVSTYIIIYEQYSTKAFKKYLKRIKPFHEHQVETNDTNAKKAPQQPAHVRLATIESGYVYDMLMELYPRQHNEAVKIRNKVKESFLNGTTEFKTDYKEAEAKALELQNKFDDDLRQEIKEALNDDYVKETVVDMYNNYIETKCPTPITDNIYISNWVVSHNVDFLIRRNIGHILALTEKEKEQKIWTSYHEAKIEYSKITDFTSTQYLNESCNLLQTVVADNQKILLFCETSRDMGIVASIIINYNLQQMLLENADLVIDKNVIIDQVEKFLRKKSNVKITSVQLKHLCKKYKVKL